MHFQSLWSSLRKWTQLFSPFPRLGLGEQRVSSKKVQDCICPWLCTVTLSSLALPFPTPFFLFSSGLWWDEGGKKHSGLFVRFLSDMGLLAGNFYEASQSSQTWFLTACCCLWLQKWSLQHYNKCYLEFSILKWQYVLNVWMDTGICRFEGSIFPHIFTYTQTTDLNIIIILSIFTLMLPFP